MSLLSREEKAIRDAFMLFLADVKSPAVIRMVRQFLENRDIESALGIVDSYVIRLGDAITHAFQTVGVAESANLAAQLGSTRLAVSFDPTNARAASMMRVTRLQFISDFSRTQREVTRNALATAFVEGKGPIAVSRVFRDSIGLTRTQQDAVANYRSLLEAGSAEALDRVVRDRRYDTQVRQAIASETPLTAAQINTMVDAYQGRMLAMRAETIARTEMQRVSNIARQESLLQAIEQTGVDPDRVVRIWSATQDDRTRDTHAEMDGQERGFNEPFESPSGALLMYPGDPQAPPGEVINCRCVVLTTLR